MQPELSRVSLSMDPHHGFGGIRNCMQTVREMERQWEQEVALEMGAHLREARKKMCPLRFLPCVPVQNGNGEEIPGWQREMMAKKKADAAYQQEEADIIARFEAWKKANAPQAPEWQRNLPRKTSSTNGPTTAAPRKTPGLNKGPWEPLVEAQPAPKKPSFAAAPQDGPFGRLGTPAAAPKTSHIPSRVGVSVAQPPGPQITQPAPQNGSRLANFWVQTLTKAA